MSSKDPTLVIKEKQKALEEFVKNLLADYTKFTFGEDVTWKDKKDSPEMIRVFTKIEFIDQEQVFIDIRSYVKPMVIQPSLFPKLYIFAKANEYTPAKFEFRFVSKEESKDATHFGLLITMIGKK